MPSRPGDLWPLASRPIPAGVGDDRLCALGGARRRVQTPPYNVKNSMPAAPERLSMRVRHGVGRSDKPTLALSPRLDLIGLQIRRRHYACMDCGAYENSPPAHPHLDLLNLCASNGGWAAIVKAAFLRRQSASPTSTRPSDAIAQVWIGANVPGGRKYFDLHPTESSRCTGFDAIWIDRRHSLDHFCRAAILPPKAHRPRLRPRMRSALVAWSALGENDRSRRGATRIAVTERALP